MLTRLTKIQLVAFVVVTLMALGLMAANYVNLPAMMGFGRYEVKVQLDETGGLYPKSVVTYRGVTVGEVRTIELDPDGGVVAILSIDDGTEIPGSATVQVRSSSVIGEQYLNFQPDPEAGPGEVLQAGDVVDRAVTSTPTSTSELLSSTQRFLESIPTDALTVTIDELGAAFDGQQENLGTLIDSSIAFQAHASDNLDVTLSLIDQLGPVLQTQSESAADIRVWTESLSLVTGTLAENDESLTQLIDTAGPTATEITSLFTGMQAVLPALLTDFAATAEVLYVYTPGIEHVLTVLPAAIEGQLSTVPPEKMDDEYLEAGLSFKLNVNTPPVCVEGFEENDRQRSPKDTSLAPLPQDSYCKVPHDDPRVVRGARNQPCPDMPGEYAATAAGCGYIFQTEEVARGQLLTGSDTASYDPMTGRMLAPNGEFFLLDQLADDYAAPESWSDYLMALGAP